MPPILTSCIYRIGDICNCDNCYYEKIGNTIKNIKEEINFEFGNNFQLFRLKDICKSISAGGDKPLAFSKEKDTVNHIPIYSNGIENDGLYGYTNEAKIFDASITISARGTIGFSCIRKTPYVPIVRLISIIPLDYVNVEYLNLMFILFPEKGQGTSTPQLTVPELKEKIIPICSLDTQRKIVEYINRIFSNITKIEVEKNSINKLVNIVKAKILDEIFSNNSSYKSYYENEYTLSELLPYEQPGPYIVKSTDYDDSFRTPVITPGKSFILGYTAENDGIYSVGNSKVIVFDDFTTSSRLIDFNFKVKSSAMKILKTSNSDMFNIDYLYYLLQTLYVNNDTHKRYWISEYAPLRVKVHQYEEQLQIINYINDAYKILDSINRI